MKKTIIVFIIFILLTAVGCATQKSVPDAEDSVLREPAVTPEYFDMVMLGGNPTPVPTPVPTPEPTAIPLRASAVVGAVGDIMVMPSQLVGAYQEELQTYDFSKSFDAVRNMFQHVDLMCGNLEGAMAGAEIGYSNGRTDEEGRIKFNAPDSFSKDLKDAGFNVITTANNHAGDCNAEGVIHTIDVLKNAGLYQTGTFKTQEDRLQPTVIDVNGIKIGVLATTTVINGSSKMSRAQKNEMFSRMQYFDTIQSEIAACKEAGAECIIMFAHWDEEYENKPQRSTKKYAAQLLEAGVDIIIGSHPHVVQPIEYMTVTRPDGTEYTGLVFYSLGNFIANMNGNSSYELYVQFNVERSDDGTVTIENPSYMPLFCFTQEYETVNADNTTLKKTIHQVIPALSDPSAVHSLVELTDKEQALLTKARNYVLNVCGTDTVPVMEDSCWIS